MTGDQVSMLRDIIGAIVFTAAVLAFINFIGDVAIQPQTAQTATSAPTTEATAEAAVEEPEAAPETTTQATPEPMPAEPMPEPEPSVKTAPEPASAPAPAAEQVEQAAVVATAQMAGDAAKGKKIFRKKCMSCHTMDKGGKNRTGPNLWGVVGRTKANAENFRYSNTMKMLGGVWSEADIMSFIAGPRTFVPDTKMTFAGLKNEADRINVLAYLKTLTD